MRRSYLPSGTAVPVGRGRRCGMPGKLGSRSGFSGRIPWKCNKRSLSAKAEGLLLFYYFPNTSQSASLTAPLKGSLPNCLPLRGKTAKRRQRRKKRAGFEEAARLAGPPGTGNRFAATVWLSAEPTERCPQWEGAKQSPLRRLRRHLPSRGGIGSVQNKKAPLEGSWPRSGLRGVCSH